MILTPALSPKSVLMYNCMLDNLKHGQPTRTPSEDSLVLHSAVLKAPPLHILGKSTAPQDK